MALVEPRSNTSVRNVMQAQWIESLCQANGVVMGALHRPWKYQAEELFSFQAAALPPERQLWVIFSNGSFGGLRQF